MNPRRSLLRAIDDSVTFNDALKWLLDNGLVVYVLAHDSVEFRVTARGRLWLQGADAFHPSNGGVTA